jgi:hypothetical protein
MKLTNKLNYPQAYVEAAKKHLYPPVEGRVGVTALTESPKIRRLLLDHWDDIVIDVEDLFTPMLGTAFHSHLQQFAPKESKAEHKVEYPVNGLVVAGKVDLFSNIIEDYKLISAWSWVFDKSAKWAEQLNIYRWLASQMLGELIGNDGKHQLPHYDKLQVHAFIKDWSSYQALKNTDYPQQRFFTVNLPAWPLDEAEHFISAMVDKHKQKDYKCNDEDKWCRTEKWAVMEKGKDKARRLLDTMAEADKWILDNNLVQPYARGQVYIQERKSECKHCLEFCPARSVCDFAKTLDKG